MQLSTTFLPATSGVKMLEICPQSAANFSRRFSIPHFIFAKENFPTRKFSPKEFKDGRLTPHSLSCPNVTALRPSTVILCIETVIEITAHNVYVHNLIFFVHSECMESKSSDLENPSTVDVTVSTGQVTVWLKHRLVQVNHSLQCYEKCIRHRKD